MFENGEARLLTQDNEKADEADEPRLTEDSANGRLIDEQNPSTRPKSKRKKSGLDDAKIEEDNDDYVNLLTQHSKASKNSSSNFFSDINDEIDFLAQEFAEQKGFEGYFKTSALFGTNVKNVFDEAIFKVY